VYFFLPVQFLFCDNLSRDLFPQTSPPFNAFLTATWWAFIIYTKSISSVSFVRLSICDLLLAVAQLAGNKLP